MKIRSPWAAIAVIAAALPAIPLYGEEPAKLTGWFNSTEFSLVLTDGNSNAESLGLSNVLKHVWPEATFRFETRAVRSVTTDKTRFAVGPDPGDYDVLEESEEDVNAELFLVGADYDHRISERTFWKIGGSWMQNRPAEIDSRMILSAGLGTQWVDTERVKYRTEYGLTWTREEQTSAADADTFIGFRGVSDLSRRLGDNTVYVNRLVLDENLDDTDDFRADFTNSLEVGINSTLALKVSLQLLYDNVPALEVIDLEFPRGTPTGLTVQSPVDDLDTLFTTSLVVSLD